MISIGLDIALRNSAIAIEVPNGVDYIVLNNTAKILKLENEPNIYTINTKNKYYFEYLDELKNILDRYDFDIMMFEGYSFSSHSNSSIQTHEFTGAIKYIYRDKIQLIEPPTIIKKLFTGKGNAGKASMFNNSDINFRKWIYMLCEKYGLYKNIMVDGEDKIISSKGISDIIDAHAILELSKKGLLWKLK